MTDLDLSRINLGVRTAQSALHRVRDRLPQCRGDGVVPREQHALSLVFEAIGVFAAVVKRSTARVQLAKHLADEAAEFARLIADGGEAQ